MGDAVVEQIKAALDIVDVIGESVRLTKKGRNYSGLCPFHDEKTPSFMVSQERQSWHCFGCSKGGDLFSFVMEKEGLSFPEALELLATRAGVELPRRGRRQETGDLFSLMESAVSFYRSELKGASGAAARAYLARRNLNDEAAARFELGWAPNAWQSLADRLRRDGATDAWLLKAGLVIEGQKGGCYDRFRGRVMFPIRNVSGRCVALGGRLIDGEGAKYLNSPEGELYSKKDNLYLLDRAKTAVRERKRAILVEGYMDALRLHLNGWTEAVASLGTALTAEQAALMRRFAPRCYICYDSDAAGQAATLRSMYLLAAEGLSVYVVALPQGKDPDELLQIDGGPAAFEQALGKALPLVRHHIGLYRAQVTERGAVPAAEDLLTSLAGLSPVEVAPYRQELSQALGLPDYQLIEELGRRRRPKPVAAHSLQAPRRLPDEPTARLDDCEAGLVYLLWSDRSLRSALSPVRLASLLQDGMLLDMATALASGHSPDELERRWLTLGETAQMAAVAQGGQFCETLSGDGQAKWRLACAELDRRRTERRFADLKTKMLRGEATSEEMVLWAKLGAKLKERH